MKKLFWLPLIAGIFALYITSCKKEDDDSGDIDYTVLYWNNYEDVKLSKTSLSSLGTFTDVANVSDGNYSGIFFEESTGFVYLADEVNDIISRVSTDGSGTVVTLFDAADGVSEPTAIVVNGSKIIWANSGSGQIKTANKDGSGAATTFYGGSTTAVGYGYGMAISGNKLYWSDFGNSVEDGIYVGNLDGTGSPALLYGADASASDDIEAPSNIAIEGSTIYWADESTNAVCSAPLNGAGPITTLYDETDGIDRADGIAVDKKHNKIYWSETDDNEIMRGNLDGSGSIETVVTGYEVYGIKLGK